MSEKLSVSKHKLLIIILFGILISSVFSANFHLMSNVMGQTTSYSEFHNPKVRNSLFSDSNPQQNPYLIDDNNEKTIFSPELKKYLQGASPKELNIPVRSNGDILVAMISQERPDKWIVPPAPFGRNWFSIVSISSSVELENMSFNYRAIRMFEWAQAPKDVFLSTDPNLNSFSSYTSIIDPLEIMGAKQAWTKLGYSGEGVTVGIVDSGVDFGNSDLSSRMHRLADGTPSVFDPSGAGIVLTPITIRPVTEEGLQLLKLSELKDFPVWTGEQFTLINSSQLGINLQDLDITAIPVKSVSGDYKFGIGVEPSGPYIQLMISVLVDSKTAHVYDTLFIDMDTSLALSLVISGVIFDGSKTYRQLVDWTLNDDIPFVFKKNDILAKDSNGDGANDISFGVLGNTLDLYGIINGKMVSGIMGDGSGYAIMYDYVGHGTSAAACIASNGRSSYPIFDNKETEIVENSTLYKLYGTAPNATIIATKFYSLADIFNAWYWAMGLEPDFELGTWVYNKEHHSEIISNSFGVSDLDVVGSIRGLDPFALFVDYATIPNMIHPLYPGSIFVIASGNAGPGVGTSATPGIAGTAITIGATSFKQFLQFNEKTPQSTMQMAMFSSRGPSPLFISKPDVSAVGEYWDAPAPVINGEGNGTYAFQLFGGTSQATPYAAGVAALVVQALKNNNLEVSLPKVKQFLTLGATDMALPSQIQGSGEINATKSILMSISENTLPISTNGTKDYGLRTNKAFNALFGMENPLISLGKNYVSTYLGCDGNNTVSVNLSGLNSLTVLSTKIEFNNSFEGKTLGRAVSYTPLLTKDEYPNNIDGIRFEFSFTNDAWQTILSSGTDKPFTIAIIDWIDKNNNGIIDAPENTTFPNGERIFLIEYKMLGQKTILDLSLKTYKPQGTLTLVIFDPDGDPQNILQSRNFLYYVHIYWMKETTPKIETITSGNTIRITLNESEVFLGKLKISTINNFTYYFPISITKSLKQVINGSYSLPYLNDSIYGPSYAFGTPNYLGRPDQGETYYLSFYVPENTDLIPIIVNWDDPSATIDVYLAKENGTIVKTSDIKYFGGGYFNSLKTEPTQQRLVYLRPDSNVNETMLLVLHVTTPPTNLLYTKINAIVRILIKEQLTNPKTIFTPPTQQVSGELSIETPNTIFQNFPELKLNKMNVELENINKTLMVKSIFNLNPTNNSIDSVISLKLYEGVETTITIISKENTGLISAIMVWWEDPISSANDVLSGYGTQNSRLVTINYMPEKTGEYLLAIDIFNTTQINNYEIKVEIDTSTKLIIPFNSINGTIYTNMLPDGNYSLKITYSTNFEGLKFKNTFNKIFTNPRTLKIIDYNPEEVNIKPGEILNINLQTDYNGKLQLYLMVILQGENNTNYPSNLLIYSEYSNKFSVAIPESTFSGNYILKITVTDGIETSTAIIMIKISTTPTLTTSNASFSSVYLITTTILLIVYTYKKRKNKS